jgi:hypothetical protein
MVIMLPVAWSVGPHAQGQVEDSTYTDPQFGYRLAWDEEVWTVTDEAGVNLSLASDNAEVYLQSGAFYGGDAVACRDDLVARLPDEENIAAVEPFTVNGEVVAAEEEGRAYATFHVTITGEEGAEPEDAIETIDCWTIVPGEAILAIIWVAPVESYEAGASEVSVLLDALEIPAFPGAAGEIPGVTEGRYQDPMYGFTVGWDSERWLPYRPTGFDLGLASGRSFILLDAFDGYDGDVEACLDDEVAQYQAARENAELSPIESTGREAVGTDEAGWQYATYTLTSGTNNEQQFVSFRCATLVEGESVLFAIQFGPLADAEAELAFGADVFATLDRDAELAPTGEASPAATAQAAATAEAGTPEPQPEDGTAMALGEPQTYTDANADWQLTYDAAMWSVQDPVLYATSSLALSNGPTTVTFTILPAYDGDDRSCLDDVVSAEITESGLVQNPVPLDVPDRIGAVLLEGYSYELSSGTSASSVFGCQLLAGGDALVIRAYLPAEEIQDQLAAVIQLIGGIASPIP